MVGGVQLQVRLVWGAFHGIVDHKCRDPFRRGMLQHANEVLIARDEQDSNALGTVLQEQLYLLANHILDVLVRLFLFPGRYVACDDSHVRKLVKPILVSEGGMDSKRLANNIRRASNDASGNTHLQQVWVEDVQVAGSEANVLPVPDDVQGVDLG